MRGTLINTATIAIGAGIGLSAGKYIPQSCLEVAKEGLGLVVMLIGVRMFFQSKNAVIVVAAVAIGGIVGVLLGISTMLQHTSEWVKTSLGGGGTFNEGLITTVVLYCVGPMTILGCLQDGMEGNSELLATKSVLDGISSVFFAATFGVSVMVTAFVVLVVQGAITLLARPLHRFMSHEAAIHEASAAGGAMMVGIGLNVLSLKKMHVENYLPALVLAPLFHVLHQRFTAKKEVAS